MEKNFKDKAVEFFKQLKAKVLNLFKKNESDTDTAKPDKTLAQKILTGVGIGLCAIFSFLLICNMVIIIKGSVSPEKPPSVFGVTPMVVLSGSMSGDAEDHIEVGDLVFINKADPDKLEVGDVIAFMDGQTTVTHRIIRIETDSDGDVQWITKGDANNKEDSKPVTEDNLVGIYSFRIPGLGDVAMFLQQPVGMLIVIGIPCLAFIIYDILRRQRSANRQNEKTSEMEAELERLRKLVGSQNEQTSVEETVSEEAIIEEASEEENSPEEISAEKKKAADEPSAPDVEETTAEEAKTEEAQPEESSSEQCCSESASE